MDCLEIRREHVAQDAYDAALLLEDQRGDFGMSGFGDGFLPALQQCLDLAVELGHGFAFGRSADDDAEIFRPDAFHKVAQAQLFGSGFDFLRDGDFAREWYEDHVSACEGYLGGKPGAFGRDWLFDDLHQQFLSDGELVGDGAVLVDVGEQLHFLELWQRSRGGGQQLFDEGGIGREMRSKVEVMKEGVLFVADVDKCGVEARHELLHFGRIDVTDGVGQVSALFLERDQTAVLSERN